MAEQAKKEHIVEQISPHSVARYLKEADLKPLHHRVWLNTKIEDHETHQKQVQAVYDVYQTATSAEENGTHVFFVLTKRPVFKQQSIPSQKSNEAGRTGKNRTRIYSAWYNYINCFSNIATGQVIASVGPTRKEKDLVHHINHVVAKDPEASYVFVMDHKSESLVRFVAEQCDIPQDTLVKKDEVAF